jgi:carbonic anhydrase
MQHKLPFYLQVAILLTFIQCERSVTLEREEAHWEYEHPDWQNIGYQSCGGNAQSPIDINTGNTIISDDLPVPDIHYQPFDLKIVDNGHTIQVNAPDNNNYIRYNEVRYDWVQLHFHHHSEHQLNMEHTDIELRCVHRDSTGNLLVLTFMIEEGIESQFLNDIFNNIPTEKKVEITPGIQIDLNEIIPDNLSYYTYYGSLTTPPCSASVQFIVLKEPLGASTEQINKFASVYSDNSRPIQPLNNRFILEKRN